MTTTFNRFKFTVKNEDGTLLCKVGSNVPPPKQDEYTDVELACILRELADSLDSAAWELQNKRDHKQIKHLATGD
jgi:hypothetical protein